MMNPAVQALAYQLDREDAERAADLEQAMRIHEDPTLFTPDWTHWREFLDGELRVLCALSVGLNPVHRFTYIDRARPCVAQMQGAAMMAVTDLLVRFDRARKHLGVSGGLPIEREAKERDEGTTRVLRSEFLSWLQRNGWSADPQLTHPGMRAEACVQKTMVSAPAPPVEEAEPQQIHPAKAVGPWRAVIERRYPSEPLRQRLLVIDDVIGELGFGAEIPAKTTGRTGPKAEVWRSVKDAVDKRDTQCTRKFFPTESAFKHSWDAYRAIARQANADR